MTRITSLLGNLLQTGISTITFSEIKKKRTFATLKYLFKKKNMLQVLFRLFLAMTFLNHNTYIL